MTSKFLFSILYSSAFSCGKPELLKNINNRSVVDYQCWPDDCRKSSFQFFVDQNIDGIVHERFS